MVWHDLKILSEHFNAVSHPNQLLRKTLEIRQDDRGFEVGHYLRLNEYDPHESKLTGKECHVRITHILREVIYLPAGYAALSVFLIYPNRF